MTPKFLLRRRTPVLALLALAAAAHVLAGPRPRVEQAKIEALLSEIQSSDAVFIRNGKEHSGPKAASHLKRKLTFAGNRVRTARDFVKGIATRSQETGDPYRVRFPSGKTRLLGEWLTERLALLERS